MTNEEQKRSGDAINRLLTVMEKLRSLDAVAYVRFASVHREFKDIDTFAREISELKNDQHSQPSKEE